MREEIIIAALIGLLFFTATAVMTAAAIKYATPSLLWDVILWDGVAGMIVSVSTLGIFISSQVYGRPFWIPALLIDLSICLATAGAAWHFHSAQPDNDYVFFSVDIRDPKNLNVSGLPLWINNKSTNTFDNVDPWFSPADAKGTPYPRDASNRLLKNVFGREKTQH